MKSDITLHRMTCLDQMTRTLTQSTHYIPVNTALYKQPVYPKRQTILNHPVQQQSSNRNIVNARVFAVN